jgi:hypothetical protein
MTTAIIALLKIARNKESIRTSETVFVSIPHPTEIATEYPLLQIPALLFAHFWDMIQSEKKGADFYERLQLRLLHGR